MARVRGFATFNGANTQLAADATEFFSATGYRQFVMDFDLFGGSTLFGAISGVSRDATSIAAVTIRIGGTSAVADGTAICTATCTQAPFTDTNISGSGTMVMPTGVQLVKIAWTSAVSAALNCYVIYLEGR